jgi:predicted transcriptional regulator
VINFGEELRTAIDSIDPRLNQFMGAVVNSFIRLEMIVLFRRESGRELAIPGIAKELGWPEERVADELAYLERSGIVERSNVQKNSYRLSADPQVADLVNKFSFLYANRSSRLLILGHLLRQGQPTRQ